MLSFKGNSMIKEMIRQPVICADYSESYEMFEEIENSRLIATNALSIDRQNEMKELLKISFSNSNRYFNILNLFKPGEILDSLL